MQTVKHCFCCRCRCRPLLLQQQGFPVMLVVKPCQVAYPEAAVGCWLPGAAVGGVPSWDQE
jgi:hypothetical protein